MHKEHATFGHISIIPGLKKKKLKKQKLNLFRSHFHLSPLPNTHTHTHIYMLVSSGFQPVWQLSS